MQYLIIPLFLAIGLLLFRVACLVIPRLEKPTPDQDMTSITRSKQRQAILWQIHSLPTCPDGTASDRQLDLWDEYYRLEKEG